GAAVMPIGCAKGSALMGKVVMAPAGVMRPTSLLWKSMNQRLPSGPAVMPDGAAYGADSTNSVTAPPGVIRPILPDASANQRLPSGPAVIPRAKLPSGKGNKVTAPAGVIRPMLALPVLVTVSVN